MGSEPAIRPEPDAPYWDAPSIGKIGPHERLVSRVRSPQLVVDDFDITLEVDDLEDEWVRLIRFHWVDDEGSVAMEMFSRDHKEPDLEQFCTAASSHQGFDLVIDALHDEQNWAEWRRRYNGGEGQRS